MENINVITKEFIDKNNLPIITNFDDIKSEGIYKVDSTLSTNNKGNSICVVTIENDIVKQTHYDNDGSIKIRQFNNNWSEWELSTSTNEDNNAIENTTTHDIFIDSRSFGGNCYLDLDGNTFLELINKYKILRIYSWVNVIGIMTNYIPICILAYHSEMNPNQASINIPCFNNTYCPMPGSTPPMYTNTISYITTNIVEAYKENILEHVTYQIENNGTLTKVTNNKQLILNLT